MFYWGAWVVQSVEPPTSAQVMILQFVNSSPTSGSVLTAQSLQSVSNSVSPCLSAPSLLTLKKKSSFTALCFPITYYYVHSRDSINILELT